VTAPNEGAGGDSVKPSKGDLVALWAVANDEVTWRSDIGGRMGFRRWSSEHDYVTCTPALKRLEARGWVKRWHNPASHGRGGVELSPAGRAVLTENGRSGSDG
jgi:hypothetical protein